tara:strand:- start:360 stop:530 length:171 start_codon:yes stop_codon:yes gene_type:complete
MTYVLKLKNPMGEQADTIQAKSLDEAKTFYMARKQLDKKTFNKIYKVEKYEYTKKK